MVFIHISGAKIQVATEKNTENKLHPHASVINQKAFWVTAQLTYLFTQGTITSIWLASPPVWSCL